MKWIVRIEGGLGNQLFQYAHVKALQVRYGGDIILDTHAYNNKQLRQVSLSHLNIPSVRNTKELGLLNQFKLKALQLQHKLIMRRFLSNYDCINQSAFEKLANKGIYLQYKLSNYNSFIKPIKQINYVSGNYMSKNFFDDTEDLLKEEFQVKEKLSEDSLAILKEIESSNSVCIHVRLGDYLAPKWKDKLYICTPEYYRKAVELVKRKIKNPLFFVFSNRHKDFEWIKEHIKLDVDLVYVDLGNSDYEDFKLMYSCKHFIMSNSTYSWWAQFMGNYEGKIVVAPSRFNNVPHWDVKGLYIEEWEIIDV